MNERIIIIPDSFKGSMSSREVASVIEMEAGRYLDNEFVTIPIADGGEGSVECILSSLGGHKEYAKVMSPENKEIIAFYGITESNETAVIEIAESSGLTKQTSFQTDEETTYGFGQLIHDAMDKGCQTIYLCLGGSATTDCGCGMAAALGIRFFDNEQKEFVPVGRTLSLIEHIDRTNMDKRITKTQFIVMSDVENPLYGDNGAAYIFGPQKGATHEEIIQLDAGLHHVSEVLIKETGTDFSQIKGSGAAGGTGAGCLAFLGANMQSGIEAMLGISHFDEKKEGCIRIITGEGKLDQQSMMGKVLSGIRKHAGNIPITTFCGVSEISQEEANAIGVEVIEIGRGIPLQEAMNNGLRYLREKANLYFRQYKQKSED